MIKARLAQLVERIPAILGYRSARTDRADQSQNKNEAGGSNPSPRTSNHKWHLYEWNRKIGRGEYGTPEFSIYMQRWMLDLGLFSIRLHCFHRSDDERAFHDHAWWFVTLILWGGYWDVTDNGEEWIGPLRLRYRPLGHRHTVRLPEGRRSWSLVLTGPYRHRWGFYVTNSLGEERFVNSKRYFLENEHH